MSEIARTLPELKSKLVELVQGFTPGDALDVRACVLELIPVHQTLRQLGVALFPDQSEGAARDRILRYFQRYPLTVIDRDELLIVSGIQEWARRLRELRNDFGWKILSGLAISQMEEEEQEDSALLALPGVKPDQYVLVDVEQDRSAALRWNHAKVLRGKSGSVRDKILEYLLQNVGEQVTGDELRYVANEKTEWARRVRELRTEFGWPIVTKSTGRPDLPVGVYVLTSMQQAPEHDRLINDRDRRMVLQRDKYSCCRCAWNRRDWDPDDPRNLEVHHVVQHVDGGSNTPDNLVTLCNICHDAVHAGEPLEPDQA